MVLLNDPYGIFPYIGLIYGRYLQFRFLKWPLKWVWCTWKKYVKQEQLEREIALKEHLSKVRTALHHDGTIWTTACHIHIEDLEMNSTNLCNIFKNHLLNRVFHNSYSLAMCQGRSGREQILEAWKWSVWEPDPPGESHALQEQLSSMQRLLDAKDRAWSSRPSTWQTTCRGLLAYIHTYMHIIYMPISNPNISLIHIVQSYQQYIFWFWGGSCCELFGTNVPLLVGLFQTTGPEDWISGDGRCGEGEMQIFMEICVC